MRSSETISTAYSEGPTPKTLPGRNCLLGTLINATFTAAVALSDEQALLCTSQGDVCLLDDTSRMQQLSIVAKVEFCIESVSIDRRQGLVYVAGERGIMRVVPLDELVEPVPSPYTLALSPPYDVASTANLVRKSNTLAIGVIRDRVITIDSDRVVQIWAAQDVGVGAQSRSVIKRLPAHESAVLGVRSLLPKAKPDGSDFLTFSKRGTVMFWTLDGTCTGSIEIPLEQPNGVEDDVINELKVVTPFVTEDSLVSGDRTGIMR